MNSTGTLLRLTVFGESHGMGIGGVLDGLPPGMPIDQPSIQRRMAERRPGQGPSMSSRDEADVVELLSGVHEGHATGAPLAFLIRNGDARSQDYEVTKSIPRPGHADLVEHIWSRGFNDKAGGGHRSGRLTAVQVAAAAIAAPILQFHKVTTQSKLVQVGTATGSDEELTAAIDEARQSKDSVGGLVRFEANGVPPALGNPSMDGLPSLLAHHLFAIPGVKGVAFGTGFDSAAMHGSAHNDGYRMDGERVVFTSNHAGGILGGRSTGEPIWGHVAFKPTSSIPQPQQSVDLDAGTDVDLEIRGRHDPCIALRGAPVVRAALDLVLADQLLLAASVGHVEPPQWP